MITSTQANPLSSLLSALNPAAASVMGSGSGVSQPRFDLTLLEMTKQVIDSTASSADIPAVPAKVQKAFESVLSTLAEQSPETQMQLGKSPDAVRFQQSVISQAAGAGGLNAEEHKLLGQLTDMVVDRVQSSLQPVIAPPASAQEEGTTRAISVLHSGPQGGTTAVSSLTENDAGSEIQAPQAAVSKDDDREISRQLPQLAAAFQSPMIVSVRTQVNADPNSESAGPVQNAGPVQAAQQNNAVVLTTSAPRPVETAEPAPPMTMKSGSQPAATAAIPQGSAPAAQAVNPVISPEASNLNKMDQTQRSERPMQVPAASDAGSQPVEAVEINSAGTVSAQPLGASPAGNNPVQAGRPQAAEAQAPKQAISQPDAPEIEVLSSSSPLPQIVPGSEVRLSDIEQIVLTQFSQEFTPLTQAQAQAPAAQAQPAEAALPASTPSPVLSPAAVQFQPVVQNAVSGAAPQAQPQAAIAAAPAELNAFQQSPVSAVPVQPQASSEPAFTPAVSRDAEGNTITPMQRFLDEASLRAAAKDAPSPLQAPLALTKDNFKSLAKSIADEFGLRENVFKQAVEAIEEASQSSSQIRIHLKPESLGSLEVALTMEGGKLTARLIASSNEVRDVFAANLSQFKQALESQGLQVNQLSVAVKADAGFTGQQPQQQWQQGQAAWVQPASEEPLQPQNPWPVFPAAGFFDGGSSTFNALA